MQRYYFIGIGGVGMSSLALFLKAKGYKIWGSDRSFDQQKFNHQIREELLSQNISIVPQNGLNLPKDLDGVIYSSAVESQNEDFIMAQKLKLPLISRAQMLAQLFNHAKGIAITGTSGKTTITGMLAQILQESSMDHSFICGGKIKGLLAPDSTTHCRFGENGPMVIEADESDGSLVLYSPKISLISNISKDHKDLEELFKLFEHLAQATQERVIINQDCPITKRIQLKNQSKMVFGLSQSKDIQLSQNSSSFTMNGKTIQLQIPGLHNIANALAAIAVSHTLNIHWEAIIQGLQKFKGIERRLEHLGTFKDIHVYDDYSHNPAKIYAALSALKTFSSRIWVIFQPHGFGPLKLQWHDLINTFKSTIHSQDHLFVLPIFDVGGTADRSISSEDFVQELIQQGVSTHDAKGRDALIHQVGQQAKSGDSIIVMGARDTTLRDLAYSILEKIRND